MADLKLGPQQQRLHAAAEKAVDAGLISPHEFDRLVDGTVTRRQLNIAHDAVNAAFKTGNQETIFKVAVPLEIEIATKLGRQGVAETWTEAVKDRLQVFYESFDLLRGGYLSP
jgi:hypothetical protein